MNARRAHALLALPLVVALAACSSSTSGKGNGGGSALPGMPTDAAGLGHLMQSATATVTSAHISLDVNAAGQSVSGGGDEKLSAGKLVALDLTENLPSGAGSLRIIIVDGKTYAKLPSSMRTSDKPYSLVTANSSNPVVKQLASSLDSALASASLGSVRLFITAAKSLSVKGTQTVGGVPTTHYSVVVDISKLPSSMPGKDALTSSGLSTLPLELYVDRQGRPVQVTEDFKVQGQSVSTKVKVTDYNKAVSIQAPPADQVDSG